MSHTIETIKSWCYQLHTETAESFVKKGFTLFQWSVCYGFKNKDKYFSS